MRIDVSIDDRVVQRKLRQIGEVGRGHLIGQAVQAGGFVLEGAAKIKAPVDLGALRNSIRTGKPKATATGAEVNVSATADYAVFVEYGTGIHAEAGNGRKTPWVYWSDRLQRFVFTRGNPAQPFMRPAIKESRGRIVQAIRANIQRLLNLAVRR